MKCLHEVQFRPITVAKSTIQVKLSLWSTSPEMLSDLSVERSTQTEECIERGTEPNTEATGGVCLCVCVHVCVSVCVCVCPPVTVHICVCTVH